MSAPLPRFVWLAVRRLRSRLALTLLSLLSVVLSVGVVVSIPVFSQGVSYLVLRDELQALAKSFNRPPLTIRFYQISSREEPITVEMAHALGDRLHQIVAENVRLPIQYYVSYVASPGLLIQGIPGDPNYTKTDKGVIKDSLHLSMMTDVGNHIEMLEGRPFGGAGTEEGRLLVWPYVDLSMEMGLQVGEMYEMVDPVSGNQIPVTVAGIWGQGDRNDFYWNGPTVLWKSVFLVTEEGYRQLAEPRITRNIGLATWYIVPDDAALTLNRADAAAQGLFFVPSLADRVRQNTRMDVSPELPLNRYVQRKASLSALLVGFSLPAMGLLFYFMWLLSAVTAQFQREEAAILAGRGASRSFLMGLASVETLLLVGVGTPLGLGLGYLMARLMGYTSNFLSFVRRNEFPATLLEVDVRLVALALVILGAARLIPTLQAAQAGIVRHLRERSRPRLNPTIWKVLVDVPLIVVTYYAYQQLSQRGTLGIIGWEPSGDPFRDPVLLLAPSLFVFTTALIFTHLFPSLMRPADALGSRIGSFAAYMGLRRLRREGNQYTGSLFLIMVCLSLGAFYSSMALSLDQWLEERIYYRIGTDFRFRQGIPPPIMGGPSGFNEELNPEVISAWLLPTTDYLGISGVEQATRVGEFKARPKVSTRVNGLFLGIDRLDFTQVAYFRNDFTQAPLGELLNRLGMYPNGILVSSRFMQRNRLLEGQQLSIDVEFNYDPYTIDYLIVGVYDYFPTVYPADTEVFIGNLNHLFEQVGDETFHQIWLKTSPTASTEELVAGVIDLGVWPTFQRDARADIVIDTERVERVGLFGVLSIGFIASSILACLGLLVYTYASLQGRLQQISVLRAIGVRTSHVLSMVSIEYAGVIVYSIVGGTLIGIVTSYLFVPFFRVSGDPAFALPPFVRHIAWSKIGWLALIFIAVLVISQMIILYSVTRRDIFQVLRMGQRE